MCWRMGSMREQEDHRTDYFWRRPSEEGLLCRESAMAVAACGQRAPAKIGVQSVNIGRLGRVAVLSAGLALLALVMLGAPATSSAQIGIGVSVSFGPPALPVYVQPPCPAAGYIWTPGYWAWAPEYGYYWVPGTWVLAPFPGGLWTPGYWGWNNGAYFWNAGYWGPAVGFYGGINYGFGYPGYGYDGGYWRRGAFYYNRSVNNVSVTNIRNVYTRNVVNNVNVTRVSYYGGRGGTTVRPTGAQLAAARQRRMSLTPAQRQQMSAARSDPRQRASINHGRPAIAATPRPGVFTGRGVVQARSAGAPYRGAPARTAPSRALPRSRSAQPQYRRNETYSAPARTAPHPAVPRSRGEQPAYRRGANPSGPYRPNAARPPTARRPQGRSAPQQRGAPHQPPKGGSGKERQPGKPHGQGQQ